MNYADRIIKSGINKILPSGEVTMCNVSHEDGCQLTFCTCTPSIEIITGGKTYSIDEDGIYKQIGTVQ